MKQLLSIIVNNKRHISGTIILAFLSSVCIVIVPLAIGNAIDSLRKYSAPRALILGVGSVLACYILRDVLGALRIRSGSKLEQNIIFRLRAELHEQSISCLFEAHVDKSPGSVVTCITDDVNNIARFIVFASEQGIVALFTIIGISVVLLCNNFRLGLFTVSSVPVVATVWLIYLPRSQQRWAKFRQASSTVSELIIEHLHGAELIAAFDMYDLIREQFLRALKKSEQLALSTTALWAVFGPLSSFVASIGPLSVLWYGGYMLRSNQTTFGQFVTFFASCTLLFQPINQLNNLHTFLTAGRVSLNRLQKIANGTKLGREVLNLGRFPNRLENIFFDKVSFAYNDRGPVLRKLSLTLQGGRVTAVVGESGCGKTTLAKLLTGRIQPSIGRILIGDTDLSTIGAAELKKNIGYLSQEAFLFSLSLRENMKLAASDASDPEIMQAIHAASAHTLFKKLPRGLDTILGASGNEFSPGERQRLAIARLILRNPSILVLDEPTAHVDAFNEALLLKVFRSLWLGRTCLIITHRLPTISQCDHIAFMSDGGIIESGCHDVLIQNGGAYAKFWTLQARSS